MLREGKAQKQGSFSKRRSASWSVKETKAGTSFEYFSQLYFAIIKKNPKLESYEVVVSENQEEHELGKRLVAKLGLGFKAGQANQLTLSVPNIYFQEDSEHRKNIWIYGFQAIFPRNKLLTDLLNPGGLHASHHSGHTCTISINFGKGDLKIPEINVEYQCRDRFAVTDVDQVHFFFDPENSEFTKKERSGDKIQNLSPDNYQELVSSCLDLIPRDQ